MAEYLEIDINLISHKDEEQELFLALLANFGFEGFREEPGRIIAYIPVKEFKQESFELFLDSHGLRDKIKRLKILSIASRNWNAIWEKEYPSVLILGKCLVRAPFHPSHKGLEYELIISPKMSFGTAHHETTRGMLEFILAGNWTGQKVLDFGSGTGILAILAEKMGANQIIALDNDLWAYRNALENIEINECKKINALHGELVNLEEHSFDTIFGNVNLNVLASEMKNLSLKLKDYGLLILSGFYKDDLHTLNNIAVKNNLSLLENRSVNGWTVAVYRKGD